MTQDQGGPTQPFIKMHGLGNDFMILDARERPVRLAPEDVCTLADRRTGIGFDQMITLEGSDTCDVFMRIHNADGGEVEACGNAARCVAALLIAETGQETATIDSLGGRLTATANPDGQITVDMGAPRLQWQDIPLARPMDTLHLEVSTEKLTDGVGVNMGNPHAVFFEDNLDDLDIKEVGPENERDPLFSEGANTSVAFVGKDDLIRLKVWERGSGNTQACGTAACAARVAAARRGVSSRSGPVELEGGTLMIDWRDDDHVYMTGPVSTVFHGSFDLKDIGAGTS